MRMRRRVALRNVWLDEIDNRIVVTAVEPGESEESTETAEAAAGFGQRIASQRRNGLPFTVRFKIWQNGRSAAGMQERAELLEKVNAWAANGGELRVNYKPGRRLLVKLEHAPGEGSLWDWDKEFTIAFRAYEIPYWEDSTVTAAPAIGGSSASKSGTAEVLGSTRTQADVQIANTSGKEITWVTVTVDGNTMTFGGTGDNLGLAAGETLVLDHVNGLFRARIRNAGGSYRSVMAKRTTGSANDLTMLPGSRAVSYSAQRACRMNVSWRSRYL